MPFRCAVKLIGILPLTLSLLGCLQLAPVESGKPDETAGITVSASAPTEIVNEGDTVSLAATLEGGATTDGVTFEWYQTYGRAVTLTSTSAADVSFDAPSLLAAQTLEFRVSARGPDGSISSDAQVTVDVAAGWEGQALAHGLAELAKSEEQLAQEFADLIDTRQDADGNTLHETASGLQYVMIKQGAGLKPTVTDRVHVHYTGWRLDGFRFDSSVARGKLTGFRLNEVIAGWTEGLQLMPVGSHYRFVIPSELAYGESGQGEGIPPDTTLVFDVYLFEVRP